MTAVAEPAEAPLLAIEDLRYQRGERAILTLPGLQVDRGRHTLVLGPSGCGKSTLLHLIAGILRPSAGRIVVAGQDFATMAPAAVDAFRGRQIGIVFQTLHLIGALTVRQNLRLAQTLAGLPVDDARIDQVLASLNIARLAARRPANLSHGEAQRAAIARALINAPALLLADEPTSALDDTNCSAVIDLLLQQAAVSGATVLIATHDQRIASRFDHRIELEATP